ncbi:MAG: TolC family protein [Candidatus Homeothermus sp.]|nr:TolC family protein [Candidatus Homeothermus sp.]
MRKGIIILILSILSPLLATAGLTIEQCVEKARDNYPMVKKYDLLAYTLDIELSDINKGWLPRIGVYGQVTAQNVVPFFPESLSGVLQQMGQPMKGLGKLQYKAGVDVSQTIWDGGVSHAQRELRRAGTAAEQSGLDVEMYAVRQRVENLYFAILLTEEQIAQNRNTMTLLDATLERLKAMLRNGTAMQSDVDMIEAQSLTVAQGIAQAESALNGYRTVLELFIGESLQGVELIRPDSVMPSELQSDRPEIRLFDTRIVAADASRRLADTALMPKVGLFAQAYYGYPGFDYFKSMINRDLSFNIMAGVKVSWNIDSFYTKRNVSRRNRLDIAGIMAEKETFLFNSDMQVASQLEKIRGIRDVMKDDSRIMALRANVRKSAESQLENGIIDTTALLTKITDENQAALTARYHEIQLVQEIYNLKYILNR